MDTAGKYFLVIVIGSGIVRTLIHWKIPQSTRTQNEKTLIHGECSLINVCEPNFSENYWVYNGIACINLCDSWDGIRRLSTNHFLGI